MTDKHWFWTLARPTLLWACLPLLFAALLPGVSDSKFHWACGLTVLLFCFRGTVDKGWLERVLKIWKGQSDA